MVQKLMQLTINVKVAQTATQHRHTIQPKAVAMTVTLFVCPHAARFSSAILCVHVVTMATAKGYIRSAAPGRKHKQTIFP